MADTPIEMIVDRSEAKRLAERFRFGGTATGDPDPFPEGREGGVPYSLLSAEHIASYVKETGMIGPFETGGGRDSRLKAAAYEGRIGSQAFVFNEDGQLKRVFSDSDDFCEVPANSIVFVESDIDFRLPAFIAVRFNLQIRHVHRGLLLGTGPLVDPGYWGKLCIPLHNLTDESYKIPRDEGLIWLEFTKTTSTYPSGEGYLGRPPLDGEFFDIRKFLLKASQPFDLAEATVPIRSSLPKIIEEARAESISALGAASESANSARSMRNTVASLGLIGLLAVSISLYSIWQSHQQFTSNLIDSFGDRVSELSSASDVAALERSQLKYRTSLIDTIEDEIEALESQISQLEAEVEKMRFTEAQNSVSQESFGVSD